MGLMDRLKSLEAGAEKTASAAGQKEQAGEPAEQAAASAASVPGPASGAVRRAPGEEGKNAGRSPESSSQEPARLSAALSADEELQIPEGELALFRDRVHREAATILAKQKGTQSREDIESLVDEIITEDDPEISRRDRTLVQQAVMNEIIGYGPLESLLSDRSVSEIMVNGPKQIYVERKGKLVLTGVTFQDDEHVRRIIDRIVSPLGRHIDDSNPMVDARLPDGSRVNAVIPPVSLCGPSLTIRKFSEKPLTVQDLIGFGSLSESMASFLEAAVWGKLNILVSGGTGSGKTTLLNVLSAFIPANERIVTIEDAAELRLMQDHVVPMESRPANLEGSGAITIRDLVRNALRMRPDRIIVGEVRGGETLDMLQAMNTGHDGSLTTAHANSPRDALSRVETMVMMAGMDLPVAAIRHQIAGALDLVVQQARLRDGSRKIVSISEVMGMEGDVITTQEIFRFSVDDYSPEGKILGHFVPTGVKPKCCDKMEANGVRIDNSWFF